MDDKCEHTNQVLVEKSDNLKNHPAKVLGRVFEHLGVSRINGIEPKRAHKRAYQEPLSPEVAQILSKFYRPDIERLEQILGWDCQEWLDAPQP